MGGPVDYHAKQNKLEERQLPHGTIYMWNLNTTQVNPATRNKNRITDIRSDLWLLRRGQGGKDWEF